MAESVVGFFLEKLNDLLTHESSLIFGVKDEIVSLENQLQWIRSFLKDADRKSRGDERVKIWVSQLRDALYEAEDVVDDFILQRHYESNHRHFIVARRIFRFITKYHTLRGFGEQIKDIKAKLEEISANKSKYGVSDIQESHEGSSSSFPQKEKVINIVEEMDVVGIEDDTRWITWRLVTGEKRRAVISIVGMGGLGKTTLAKKVYSNIKGDFKCHAWISVSQEYDVRVLMLNLIQAIMVLPRDEMDIVQKMDIGNLSQKLAEYLKENQYLIVVDDIWSMEGWDVLLPVLPDAANGSRVMLTTRNKEVALHADATSIPHELKFLPEDKCWELFCKKSFPGNVKVGCPPELERWGKEIVARCGGLPLAIIILGGLLSRKQKVPSEWEKVYKSISWQWQQGQNNISGILGMSYNDLPYFLKSCFLYCGAFPEDFEFTTKKLIRLWIAEGFIQRRGAETMEEVAEDCLGELIQRSMIQVAKKSYDGRVKACRIHDLLRELAISEAKESKFFEIFVHGDESSFSALVRRLVIYHDTLIQSLPLCHLRTLLRFTMQETPKCYLENVFNNANYLRVIDLEGVYLSHLPHQVGKLFHLRYLGLRKTGLKELPDSIGNLFNLQTLDIRETNCKSLPKNLSSHQALRHLCMGSFSFQFPELFYGSLVKLPEDNDLRNLTNLETLTGIVAGNWISSSLRMLTNLRHLGVGGVSCTAHIEGFDHSLSKMTGLHSLWMEGRIVRTPKLVDHNNLYKIYLVGYLEKLPTLSNFPLNLTKLFLQESDLTEDPLDVLMGLPKLKILGLLRNSYSGDTLHCKKGGFLELEELIIQLKRLTYWIVNSGALTNLRSLSLIKCSNLLELPIEMASMRSLRKLNLLGMPDQVIISLQENNGGQDYHKIEHIPYVTIEQ